MASNMIVISVMFSGRCMVYGVWVYGVWAEDTATLVSLPINYTL